MGLTSIQEINAEIRRLEAQKKIVATRDREIGRALAILSKYADVLTTTQRRQATKIANGNKVAKSSALSKKAGRKLGKVPPKYRLPTGETWAGRGLTPKVFLAWEKSPEGKAWSRANAGDRFPPAGGSTPASAAPRAPATKKRPAKKAGGTTIKKAARKAKPKTARKVAKKTARKAAKKAVR